MQELNTFKFWCQKVLPLVYDDSLSYYEVLCKVVDYINKLIGDSNSMIEKVNKNSSDIEQLKNEMQILNSELEKVKNGDYVSLYIDSLSKWIDENLIEMVYRIAKFVQFYIDDDGYWYAVIPKNWDFLKFDTGYDVNNLDEYMHLIIEY